MPPILAAVLTIGLVIWLFARDPGRGPRTSAALWLPFAWMVITGSRFISQWMAIGARIDNQQDGSTIDAIYFGALILAGIMVLAQRRVRLAQVISDNRWLAAFLFYCLLSTLWSDDPMVAAKRWIKVLGHPVMALIILTERDPSNAFRIVMRRLAYVLMPLSVLFVKYFPEYGRGFDQWTGAASSRGVALTKNDLGYICMAFGLFCVWNILTLFRRPRSFRRSHELLVSAMLLLMALWLLRMSDSMTSLMTLALGVATLLVLRVLNPRSLGTVVVVVGILVVGLQVTFDVYTEILRMLGRNPTLTDRTAVWADALALQANPFLGAGFESFWLGERLAAMWSKWWWQPTQAHNGYIEVYLNLGLIGVGLLLGLLVSTFHRAKRELLVDFDFASVKLAYLVAIVAFNYTEAAFKGVHLMWTLFYLIAATYSVTGRARASRRQTLHAPGPRGVAGAAVPRPWAGRERLTTNYAIGIKRE